MKFKQAALLSALFGALAAVVPAQAATYSFAAALNGPSEFPPVASSATGSAFVTFDDVALTVAVTEIFIGLTAPATASHIHCCTAAAGTGTAPVVLGFTGFPAATTGIYTNTFTLSGASFASLLAGTQAGLAYVNVHDAVYPGGEMRGFLITTAVPEPASYGLLAAGLAAVGWASRRRRQG